MSQISSNCIHELQNVFEDSAQHVHTMGVEYVHVRTIELGTQLITALIARYTSCHMPPSKTQAPLHAVIATIPF